MELSSSNLKKKFRFSQKKAFLIFSQKKVFLIFPGMKPYTFQPKIRKLKKSTPGEFLRLQETETPKHFLYFLKRKLFLYFRKRKL